MQTIRDRSMQLEELTLSPKACFTKDSKGREYKEDECDLRTCYQKDRDKILHSKSFRRLKQKTQVFISPVGDHFRTRLTHTLEVCQIARTIARALRLNEDLTEAIALGHDLGHTPFGHAGERVLNKLNPNGFKHSIQSVRVARHLEKNLQGLNLTYETLDGILNHGTNSNPQTLEGAIVKFSDKIAYINHDIEDAIAAGILKQETLPEDCVEVLGVTKSQRISTLINSIVDNSYDEIKMDELVYEKFRKLRAYLFANLYTAVDAATEQAKVEKLITDLYHYFKNHTEEMPQMYQEIIQKDGVHQAVTDYIQGMSDDYARRLFEDLFIPKSYRDK